MTNVAFDGTTYLVVLRGIGSYTSTNGSTWTTAGSGTFPASPLGITAGPTGSFLATTISSSSSNTATFTSNTGATWTAGTFSFTGVAGIQTAFGNGVYVAVGTQFTGPSAYRRRIDTSTNGTTWTSRYAPATTPEYFYAVTFTNLGSGFFIAGGDGSTRIMYSDSTGTTWTNATISGSLTSAVQEIIDGGASASPRFVAVTNSTAVVTSNDGVNWTVVTLPAVIYKGQFSFTNGRWLFTDTYGNTRGGPNMISTSYLQRLSILTSG
jgi:hypothetical protein